MPHPRRLSPLALGLLALVFPSQLGAAVGVEKIELVTGIPIPVGGVTFERASLSPKPVFSDDSRYVVFDAHTGSIAAATADANGLRDVFLADLQTGDRLLLTHALGRPDIAADGDSYDPLLSADGRFVAFTSTSTDLVASGAAGSHVYLLDRQTGAKVQVTQAAGSGGEAHVLTFSSDGRFLAFQAKDAATLVPGATDANAAYDLFLWDRVAHTFQLVTHRAGDPFTASAMPSTARVARASLSSDGRYLVYTSEATELHAGDTTADNDVYLFDRNTGVNTLVSRGGGDAHSFDLGMSADGGAVLFNSKAFAESLIPGAIDPNAWVEDLFVYVRATGNIELISHAAGSPLQTASYATEKGVLSPDGRRIYFISKANNLVAGISDPGPISETDLFLHDRQTGTTTLLSPDPGNAAAAANRPLYDLRGTSDAGTTLFFEGSSGLIAGPPANFGRHVYRLDHPGQLSMIGALPGQPNVFRQGQAVGWAPDLSTILFQTVDFDGIAVPDLVGLADPFHHGDLLLFATATQSFELMNPAVLAGRASSAISFHPPSSALISGNGRYVTLSSSTEVCGLAGSDLHRGCFFDRVTGQMRNLLHAWDDPETPVWPGAAVSYDISYDGRKLLLGIHASDLPPNDPNDIACDLVLYDTVDRTYELISHTAGNPNQTANSASCFAGGFGANLMSDDLRNVVFGSYANDVVAGVTDVSATDVFVKNRGTGVVRLLSSAAGDSNRTGNCDSSAPQISKTGFLAVFSSCATDLIPGFVDNNGVHDYTGTDLYLVNLLLGTRTLVTHAAGAPTAGANGAVRLWYRISTDARFIAYESFATNLIAGGSDTNSATDVFLFDSGTGQTTLVSHAAGQPTVAGNSSSSLSGLSSDGRFVLLESGATDFVPGVGPGQLYLWDRLDGSRRLVTHRHGAPSIGVGGINGEMSADGRRVVFSSYATAADLVPGTVSTGQDVFVWSRDDDTFELISRRLHAPERGAGARSSGNFFQSFDNSGETLIFSAHPGSLVLHDANGGWDLFIATLSPTLLRDGFETGDTSQWSAAVP